MIIYKATNNINGKVYIGQTISDIDLRKRKHAERAKRGEGHYFHNALRKYGENNFYWMVLNECYDIDTLNQLEEYYIACYDSINRENGYNLESGGKNYIVSDETKKKLSESKSGENHWNWGKKHPPETIEKMRQVKLGKNNPMYGRTGEKNPMFGVRFYGKDNHNYGKKWSQEQKDRQSIRAKNRILAKRVS